MYSRVSNTFDRSCEGCGVNLEMSSNFNKFLDVDLCLNKCRHKFYCTVCITILDFRMWKTGDFWVRLEERLRAQRSKQYGYELSMLIPQVGEKTWGEKRRKLNNLAKPRSDPVPGPSSRVSRDPGNPGVSRDQFSSGSVVSRERVRSRTKKAGHDEMSEGKDATSFLDDPEFRFEAPEDVENIELF